MLMPFIMCTSAQLVNSFELTNPPIILSLKPKNTNRYAKVTTWLEPESTLPEHQFFLFPALPRDASAQVF
jgi:hypothetical protein